MANINKIRISGTSYDIQDSNAPKVVELTQAQYDALVDKDPNVFYIITDASQVDLSQYWSSAQTNSAITEAVSGKADSSSVYLKSETSGATQISTALATKQDTLVSGTNVKTINNESILGSGNITIEGGGSSYTAGDGIDITNDVISVTGKVDTSAFTAHTADTVIHVTASEKSTWNNKSDFSGDYNDLSNKPTIPTSASQLTNDSGYITSDDITGKTNQSDFTAHTADTTIHVTSAEKATWNAKSDFSGSYNDLTNKLSAGTNITIVDNVISAEGGGGKAVTGGTNISVTTGETADTINCTLPIYINQNNGKGDINIGTENNANYDYYRIAIGRRIDMSSANGGGSIAIGVATTSSVQKNECYGGNNVAIGRNFQIGESNSTSGVRSNCVVIGNKAKSLISYGVAIGSEATVSGTTKTNINNQLTIDTSNQVYIYNKDNTEMICLQDALGGGGVSYSAGTGIDITNDVISVTGMVDTTTYSTYTAATDTALSNKQTTLTAGTGISIVDNVISATGGGGGGNVNVVELTQAQYDALTTIDPDAIYVITDAQGGDLSQYMTSAQTTSAITQATSDKVSTSAITTSITSSSTDAQIPSAKAVYDIVGDIETLLSQI